MTKIQKQRAKGGKTSKEAAAAPKELTAEKPVIEDIKLDDLADVSEERANIISIVKGFEGQVETAFKLKEALEEELQATRAKLSDQMNTCGRLEAQVEELESQAALAEQLREDIAFVEEDRNKFSDELTRLQPQLKAMKDERDRLAKQLAGSEKYVLELESEKMALEAQVMNLKDQVADAERMQKELADLTETNSQMREQLRRLKSCETSNELLKTELGTAHQTMRNMKNEIESLRGKVAAGEGRLVDLRVQLEDQQSVGNDLLQVKARLENELQDINIRYQAAETELNNLKGIIRDIRSEATLTSGRVRQKYFKPGKV